MARGAKESRPVFEEIEERPYAKGHDHAHRGRASFVVVVSRLASSKKKKKKKIMDNQQKDNKTGSNNSERDEQKHKRFEGECSGRS